MLKTFLRGLHQGQPGVLQSEADGASCEVDGRPCRLAFDEPRRAVEEADDLVQKVMDRLSNGFKEQREHLEREWGDRDEVSTEDLRVALRHYRAFFDRLLNV